MAGISDTVPTDPSKIAELVAAEVDKAPDVSVFIKPEIPVAEPIAEPVNNNNGFLINEELPVLDEEDENA